MVRGPCRLRSGLIVQGDLTRADGHAERHAALDMIHLHSPGSTRRLTLAADEAFGWAKTVGGMPQTFYRGVERGRDRIILTMAVNNLPRLPKLLAA